MTDSPHSLPSTSPSPQSGITEPIPPRSKWPRGLQQALAIAQLTAGEALRSRFLLGVTVAGLLVLVYVAQIQAVTDAERVLLLRQGLLQAISIITIVGTLFLGAFTLPQDIETRRVYTLITKPVTRGMVFLGRFLGFAWLAAIMMAVLGALSFGVFLVATSGLRPELTELRGRILPSAITTWGAQDERSSERGLPRKSLLNEHESGIVARFAVRQDLFDDARPRLDVRLNLRTRANRDIRETEIAWLSVRRVPDDSATLISSVPPTLVQMRLRDRMTFSTVLDPVTTPGDLEIALWIKESPYSVVLEPDSLVLRTRAEPAGVVYLGVLLVEYVKVLLVVATVVALSAAFTPYTSMLGGLFVLLMAMIAGSLHRSLADFARQVTHAKLQLEKFGRPLDTSMAISDWFMGDPNSAFSGYALLRAFGTYFPSFDRIWVTSDYVAGIVPSTAECVGGLWFYGLWVLIVFAVGWICFSLREVP